MDEDEAKILEKLMKDILQKSGSVQATAPSAFSRPGVYLRADNRWLLIDTAGRWEPYDDGLYMVFDDNFDFKFINGPAGDPFMKLAQGVRGSIKAVVRTFPETQKPSITFICVNGGKPVFSKSFEPLPWFPDVATMVAYFAIHCPSVKRKDVESVYEVCPCAKF